ncbi:MAG: Hsp70 family protein, partial [Candidatus Brocadiae bacterium]|nr:Hsp70 family protein [Candidatus Brocadiia bacterium]
LEVLRIINEPTAAALAYGLDRKDVQTVLVWDLGGGTFDVSILELGDGLFEVKAVNGNSRLGGDDWDEVVLMLLAERLRRETGFDVLAEPRLRRRALDAAERAKRDLSDHAEAFVSLTVASGDAGGPHELCTRLTRAEFEAATSHLLQRLVGPTRQALKDAHLEVDQIERVVLVGSSTRMPAVRALVREMFRQEPYTRINPDEVVAIGAAVQAGMLSGLPRRAVLVDVIPLSLGVRTEGGLFSRIIKRNTTIPCSASQLFTNAADAQQSMHVEVLQGEREVAAENVSLGSLNLDIPPLARGRAQVEVTFLVDADGVVRVEAEDLHTENRSRIEIQNDALLGDEDLDARLREAEALYAEDMRRRREVEARIRAQNALRESAAVVESTGGAGIHLPEVQRHEGNVQS